MKQKSDILNDSFSRLLLNIGLPLYNTCVVSIFTTTLVNRIYSEYVGQVGFSVIGALNIAATAGISVTGSIALGAWIKDAPAFCGENPERANRSCWNSLYTLVLSALAIILFMIAGQEIIFRIMSIPQEIYVDTKKYYYGYIWTYIFNGTYLYLGYIVNAKGSRTAVLIANMMPVCSLAVIAFLFLGVFHMGIEGIALSVVVQYLLQTIVNYRLLLKEGILQKVYWKVLRPVPALMISVLKYGMLLAAQILLCCIAEAVVSIQTNRYLSVEYIAVIAVTLPLSGPLGVMASLGTAFIPNNYAAGKVARLKRFMSKITLANLGYASICFVVYVVIGKWYYGRLFDSDIMAAMGSQYWFWFGLSMIPLGMINVFRTFFDAIGKGNISMLSGIGELLGRVLCGFWLIPSFGNIGRSVAPLVGFGLGALLLVLAYLVLGRRIYDTCSGNEKVTTS